MAPHPVIVVDGTSIHEGTSVYHTEEYRVLWVVSIGETTVELSTIDRTAEVDRESFREKIVDGTVVVERPLTVRDGEVAGAGED